MFLRVLVTNPPNGLTFRRLVHGNQELGDESTYSGLEDMYLDTGAVKNLKVLRAFLKIETDKQIVQDVSKQM